MSSLDQPHFVRHKYTKIKPSVTLVETETPPLDITSFLKTTNALRPYLRLCLSFPSRDLQRSSQRSSRVTDIRSR